MDEVIWVETLAPHRETARQRVTGPSVTIGRAYDNDIVLDDPYVAPHHVRLLRAADGRWNAEDLGTINGMRVAGIRRDHAELNGDTALQIGQTGIRLRASAYPVPPELPLPHGKPRWSPALLCLAAVFGLAVLQTWLNETGESKLISYLGPLISVAILAAVWVSGWSVMSRILTGRAQFGRYLFIASVGLLISMIYDMLMPIGAFALSLPALQAYGFVCEWLIFAAICFAHLRAIGPARLILKAVCVLVLAGLGIGIQSLNMSDARANSGQPATALLQKLEPPALRLVPPQSANAFFASTSRLKAALDQERNAALPAGSDDDNN